LAGVQVVLKNLDIDKPITPNWLAYERLDTIIGSDVVIVRRRRADGRRRLRLWRHARRRWQVPGRGYAVIGVRLSQLTLPVGSRPKLLSRAVEHYQNTVVAVALGTAVHRWPSHGSQVSNGNRRLCTSRPAR